VGFNLDPKSLFSTKMLGHGACLFPTSKSLKYVKDDEFKRVAIDTSSFSKIIPGSDVQSIVELAWAVLLREYTGESYVSFGSVTRLFSQFNVYLVHYQLDSASYTKDVKRDAAYELESQRLRDLQVNTAICFCDDLSWRVDNQFQAEKKLQIIQNVRKLSKLSLSTLLNVRSST
jgi:hypothetical protein